MLTLKTPISTEAEHLDFIHILLYLYVNGFRSLLCYL